jgi:succinoglycan biosynthesis transport protein ExoP
MKDESLPALTGKNGHLAAMPPEEYPVSEFEEEPRGSGLNLYELLFILFRHKWKILLCAAAGLLAAAAIFLLLPPIYESEAKLFVRYVVDKSAVDGLDAQIKTPNPQTDTVIYSEVQILSSSDLAREVAQAIGVDRLVPGGGPKATLENATDVLYHGLEVSVVPATNILSIVFKSGDPKLPMPVLQELVRRYFDKHLEVHRSAGAFDFVTKEVAELQNQLNQTEAELKELKAKAGVVSLAESTGTLATELGKSQQELDTAEAELASQKALVKDLERSRATTDVAEKNQAGTPTRPPTGDIVQKYQSLVSRVTLLQQAESELLSKYTPENRLVKSKEAQIASLEKQRGDLETKYPALIDTAVVTNSSSQSSDGKRSDLMTERARLVGLQTTVDALTVRVAGLKQRASLIAELGPRIEELERKKEVEEANYKHSEASLEKARIDETLDPSRMPNISVVQTPLPATKFKRNIKNFVIGLAGGGIALGVAMALLIELVLDRTVKRSTELEQRLRIPLLLSIPNLSSNGHRLRLHDSGQNSPFEEGSAEALSALDDGELLRPFCEAIRDRLGLYFEMNHMSHKPKLVAVTGLAKNAGASTLAAGLASTLSVGAEGRVLLVDKPISMKRFYNMLTDFKASNHDYVVFDLPALGDTSSTVPLAGFMDTVLLVVEAEKSNRDAVKRAYAQLAAKTNVSVVFNKTRSYGPKWLEVELK